MIARLQTSRREGVVWGVGQAEVSFGKLKCAQSRAYVLKGRVEEWHWIQVLVWGSQPGSRRHKGKRNVAS